MQNRHEWGFACGRVSALEGGLLSKDFFLGLLAQSQPEDLVRQLQELPLADHLKPGLSRDECSALIDTFYYAQVVSLRNDCPTPAVADLFLLPGDYLNLKRALLRQGSHPFHPGLIPLEKMAQVAAGDTSALPNEMKEAVVRLGGHSEDVKQEARLDMVLDGAYLRHARALSAEIGAPLITAYVEEMVFARAIAVLWRASVSGGVLRDYQQHFMPIDGFTSTLNQLAGTADVKNWGAAVPGKLGAFLDEATQLPDADQLPRFEQHVANDLLATAHRGLGQVLGPERVFGYLAALATQTYNLKLAVCGRLNRIEPDVLRQRLRETYG